MKWEQREGGDNFSKITYYYILFKTCVCSIQLLSRVQLFATPQITARQASLSITNSQSTLKLMSIESVMPSSHLILCCPLLLLPPSLSAPGSFLNSSHEVAKVLEFQLQHQSFQWIFRIKKQFIKGMNPPKGEWVNRWSKEKGVQESVLGNAHLRTFSQSIYFGKYGWPSFRNLIN